MTPQCFNTQIARLKQEFGDKAFSRERAILIDRAVSGVDDASFVAIVDGLIGSREPSKPPMVPDFQKAVSAWRERQAERSRTQHRMDDKEAFGKLSSEGVHLMCDAIRGVISGKVPMKVASDVIAMVCKPMPVVSRVERSQPPEREDQL